MTEVTLLVGVLAWRHETQGVRFAPGSACRVLDAGARLALVSDDGARAVVRDAAGRRWRVPAGFLATSAGTPAPAGTAEGR